MCSFLACVMCSFLACVMCSFLACVLCSSSATTLASLVSSCLRALRSLVNQIDENTKRSPHINASNACHRQPPIFWVGTDFLVWRQLERVFTSLLLTAIPKRVGKEKNILTAKLWPQEHADKNKPLRHELVAPKDKDRKGVDNLAIVSLTSSSSS